SELGQDRGERFDLSCAPLMRFTLIRLSAQQHRLVLTHHHLLMDGWSLPVLVRELLTLYEHKGDGAALGRVAPYRDYVARRGGRGVAAGFGGGGGGHACGGARSRADAGCGRADHACAESAAEHGAERAGAPAWSDAQYLHAGGVGALARPYERA